MVEFDKEKIYVAIMKAMTYGSGIVDMNVATHVALDIEDVVRCEEAPSTVEAVEALVFDMLIEYGAVETARAYESYRSVQAFKRENNTTDKGIMGIINQSNVGVLKENSNKNGELISTQRDLVAGIVSNDILKRKILPAHIVDAWESGKQHFHDGDYGAFPYHNCETINIYDMLMNGTVINKRQITKPKSLLVAATLVTQIIVKVTSSSYGGSTIFLKDIAPFVKVSEEKYFNLLKDTISDTKELEITVDKLLQKEIKDSIQLIRYQLSTISNANGQSSFCTFGLEVDEDFGYVDEQVKLVTEMLNQRMEGMTNEDGIKTYEALPKLIYRIEDHNNLTGGKYDDLTKLAIKCVSETMAPDFLSHKNMQKVYGEDTARFFPMGL